MSYFTYLISTDIKSKKKKKIVLLIVIFTLAACQATKDALTLKKKIIQMNF